MNIHRGGTSGCDTAKEFANAELQIKVLVRFFFLYQEVENTNHINAITIKTQNSAGFLHTTTQTAAIAQQGVSEKGGVMVCWSPKALCQLVERPLGVDTVSS